MKKFRSQTQGIILILYDLSRGRMPGSSLVGPVRAEASSEVSVSFQNGQQQGCLGIFTAALAINLDVETEMFFG